MFELLREFLLELIRALLVEEMSSRVRDGVANLVQRRKRRRRIRRFIHTLRTKSGRDL